MKAVKEQVNERPILFNGEMVRAILDGRKTQTRRVLKNVMDSDDLTGAKPRIRANYHFLRLPNGDEYGPAKCLYGEPGDELWVRETFVLENTLEYHGEHATPHDGRPVEWVNLDTEWEHCLIPHYRATEPEPHIVTLENYGEFDDRTRWKPSIFMPRWASRITLKVTDVRVERVQDISEDDAKAEGVEPVGTGYMDYSDEIPFGCHNARESFASLWDSINAKRGYGWDANPWCWVVEFERVQS